jgi:hypothetical protein
MSDERLESSRDDGIATFVIRIRMEGTETEGGQERGWVAHVTNVLEQSDRYVRDLKDLVHIIEEYLNRMGMGAGGRAKSPGATQSLDEARGVGGQNHDPNPA